MRFQDETEFIRKSMNRFVEEESLKEPSNFSNWAYSLYVRRFAGNTKLAETKLISLLASLDAVYTYWEQFNLFYQFINEIYDKTDLNCFLLLRSLVKRDLEDAIRKNKFKRKKVHLYNFPLTPKKCSSYLNEIFKESQAINVELIMRNMLVMLKKHSSTENISAYDFLAFTTREYKAIREKRHAPITNTGYLQTYLTKSGPIQDDTPKSVYANPQTVSAKESIREEMKKLVNIFVDAVLAEELPQGKHQQSIIDAKELIMSKFDNFLTAIFTSNKVLWFKELMVEDPEEAQMSYVEDLLKQYRKFSTNPGATAEQYKEFCKQIFKTPEVSDQISSLLTYIIEGNSAEESIFKLSKGGDHEEYEDINELPAEDEDDQQNGDDYQYDKQETIFDPENFNIVKSKKEYEDYEEIDDEGIQQPLSFGRQIHNEREEEQILNVETLKDVSPLKDSQSLNSSRFRSEKSGVKGLESFGREYDTYKVEQHNLAELERLYQELESFEKANQTNGSNRYSS